MARRSTIGIRFPKYEFLPSALCSWLSVHRNDGDTVTLDSNNARCHSYTMPPRITIKELHAATGEQVRRAGTSRSPVVVTDRGRPVAVLANPSLLKPRSRKRKLLPEFQALMARSPGSDLHDDLDAVRGDR